MVTAFTFRTHPVSNVMAGPTFWPMERSGEILQWYREFQPSLPREMTGFFAYLTVPPVAPFPEELHMKQVCGVVWCYNGDAASSEELFAPVVATEPLMHGVGEMPFPMIQSAFDGLYPKGEQWYWRADFVRELSDDAIAAHVAHGDKLPTWKSTMHLYPIDGAVHDVASSDSAFAYRDAGWAEVIVGVDPDPANADMIRQWTVDYYDATHPYSAGGAYVNFMMDEGQERVQATLRGELRPADEGQGGVRPRQHLPRQPEHPTRLVASVPRGSGSVAQLPKDPDPLAHPPATPSAASSGGMQPVVPRSTRSWWRTRTVEATRRYERNGPTTSYVMPGLVRTAAL